MPLHVLYQAALADFSCSLAGAASRGFGWKNSPTLEGLAYSIRASSTNFLCCWISDGVPTTSTYKTPVTTMVQQTKKRQRLEGRQLGVNAFIIQRLINR
jgi:hypothetical protein